MSSGTLRSEPEAEAEQSCSLEGLAARSGITPRTIRYYQSEGLLPQPSRVGREARYGEAHVERLRLIATLQDRGLRLSAIGELLRSGASGGDAEEWLGLGEAMQRPWVEDGPVLLRREELEDRVGDLSPNAIALLERIGAVDRRTDTVPEVFVVPSPGLLDVAIETTRLGVPPEAGARMREVLQARLRELAAELVSTFTEEVSAGHLAEGRPGDLAALLEALQPLTRRTVDLLFAHEMERAQRTLLDAIPTENPEESR